MFENNYKLDRGQIFEIVRRVVAGLGEEMGIAEADVRPETSLVDDVGLDSIKFVDLTIALEDALQIERFPMQDWADLQLECEGPRFTIGALVDACAVQLGV